MDERRQFLRVLGGSVLLFGCGGGESAGTVHANGGAGGLVGLEGGCKPFFVPGRNPDHCSSNAGKFDVGTLADFPSPGLYRVANPDANTLVGRDAAGLWAMSSLCTHQCCDMNSAQKGTITTDNGEPVVVCNCHGSEFASDGSVLVGPAQAPLDHYAITLACDGHLHVDTTRVVPATQRLAV